MPTYQYACTECGHAFEQVQSFSDDTLTVCPECEGRLRKVFNAVGVVFKGSGFYRNDSRKADSSSISSSSESKSESTSDSKSESTSGSSDSSSGEKKSGSSEKKSDSTPAKSEKKSDSSSSSGSTSAA
ncbi:MAG: FmdB family zinc ribbon protein [Nocardioidaceae bacterium]